MKKGFFQSERFPDKIVFEVDQDKIEPGLHETMLVEVSASTFRAAIVSYLRKDVIAAIEKMDDDEFIAKIINGKVL